MKFAILSGDSQGFIGPARHAQEGPLLLVGANYLRK
jgi:hypothetical protein